MAEMVYRKVQNNELYHFGTKGQKWGVRNYQNADGSLTPEGRIHYGYGEAREKAKNKLLKAKSEKKQAKKEYSKASTNLAYTKIGIPRMLIPNITKKQKLAEKERDEVYIKSLKKSINKDKDYKEAKKNYKKELESINKDAVKNYLKVSKRSDELAEKEDEMYTKAYSTKDKKEREKYISKAKEYAYAYEKARKDDKVDEAYKATGKNAIDRLINNIKYD